MHPECQEKVFQEILSVMPNPDVDITPLHLNRMIYLDQCIREAQRLFPTVPLIGRRAHETINLNGFDIPPNIPIFIGIRQIHRRRDYYGPDSLEYKPDRFKPTQHHPKKDLPGAYIPFSLGQRNCIGIYPHRKRFCFQLICFIYSFYFCSPLWCAFQCNRY